jgi:hypothetical protein
MRDPFTDRVHITRNIIWLRCMFLSRSPELGEDKAVYPVISLMCTAEVGERMESGTPSSSSDEESDSESSSALQSKESNDSSSEIDSEESDSEATSETEPESLDAEEDRSNSVTVRTTSWRSVNEPRRLIEEIGTLTADHAHGLVVACAEWALKEEVSEYVEVACVGAGIGGGFTSSTKELRVMSYKEVVMGPDRPYWLKAINEEHAHMIMY